MAENNRNGSAGKEPGAAVWETASPSKATFGQKLKRHCARFWWLHVIIFIVVVLVVTLPVVYVGYPNIAQSDIDDSTLEVTAENVTNPTADSVHLTLVSTIRSDSKYHPKLDSFNASLFLESTEPDIKPFGYITIPGAHSSSEFNITVDQEMVIADMDQFIAYNLLVMNSEEYRIAIRGRLGLKQGGLPHITVNYNKAVTMKGLNKLAGFSVSNLSADISAPDGEPNVNGVANIYNPSVMTLELGNVTMDMSVDSTPIGQALLPNLILYPGNNTAEMHATTNISRVLSLVTETYTDGNLPVTILGNSSVNADGEHLPYFEAAIKQNEMHLDLNLNPIFDDLGLNLTSS